MCFRASCQTSRSACRPLFSHLPQPRLARVFNYHRSRLNELCTLLLFDATSFDGRKECRRAAAIRALRVLVP
eukprot:3801603-Pleurochrysis_carterae.AAC.1